MIRLVAEGKLKPVVDSVHPLPQARDAYEKLRRRNHFGKIILQATATT